MKTGQPGVTRFPPKPRLSLGTGNAFLGQRHNSYQHKFEQPVLKSPMNVNVFRDARDSGNVNGIMVARLRATRKKSQMDAATSPMIIPCLGAKRH